jgi:hypothetical protein
MAAPIHKIAPRLFGEQPGNLLSGAELHPLNPITKNKESNLVNDISVCSDKYNAPLRGK